MKTLLRSSVAIVTVCAILSTQASAEELTGKCNAMFYAKSTIHNFSGSVTGEQFVAVLEISDQIEQTTGAVTVIVNVASMDTGHKGINKNMLKMFEANKFPFIIGSVTNARPYSILKKAWSSTEKAPEFDLNLRIREVERPVTATITGISEGDDFMTLTVEFNVSLKEFKLKPSSLLGILRVRDTVRVKTDIEVEKPSNIAHLRDYLPYPATSPETDERQIKE